MDEGVALLAQEHEVLLKFLFLIAGICHVNAIAGVGFPVVLRIRGGEGLQALGDSVLFLHQDLLELL